MHYATYTRSAREDGGHEVGGSESWHLPPPP